MSGKVIESLVDRILELEGSSMGDTASTRQFVNDMKNCNTQLATKCHVGLFSKWLRAKSEMRAPEEIDAQQLNIHLAQFILTIRKEGDEDIHHPSRQYEPCSLTAMYSSVSRYLISKEYEHNLKTSELFRHSREVLSAKMKELKQLGKGNRPHAAEPFTTDEIAKMYEMNILGVGKLFNSLFLVQFYAW
jgi:hypothetical protein